MTEQEKTEIVNKVREMLARQRFADWYNPGGRFDQWISGDADAPPQEAIDADIRSMLGL